MDDLENQMNAILNNPEMMQNIMAMAQAMNQSQSQQSNPSSPPDTPNFSLPDIDLSMVQKLSGLAGKSNIDANQRTLLKALTPYLSRERISKLERAMRAAKMANLASVFLGNNGYSMNTGR